jgi:hypothetical protein
VRRRAGGVADAATVAGKGRARHDGAAGDAGIRRRTLDGRGDGRGGGEAEEERRKAEVLAAIECEQERLQIALSQLHAAKQLVETQRLTHAPSKYGDAPPYHDDAPPYHEDALPYHDDLGASYHHPPYDEQRYGEAG